MGSIVSFPCRTAAPAAASIVEADCIEILRQCAAAIDRLQVAATRLATIAALSDAPRPTAFIDEVHDIIAMLARFDPLDPGSRRSSGALLAQIQDLKDRILAWRPSLDA